MSVQPSGGEAPQPPIDPATDPRAYWESRLAQEFDLAGVGFRVLGPDFNEAMYRVRARVFRRVVRRLDLDRAGARVLDIGSGTGFYVEQWRSNGAREIVASDLTSVAVEKLAAKFPGLEVHRLDIGDPVAVPGGRPFDAVSAFDVLFHVVDDERYARAIRNVSSFVRPEGWFVFSDNFLHRPAARASTQVSRTLAEIEEVVRAEGFDIVRRVPMFVLMNAPIDARGRWLKKRWNRLLARLAEDPARGRRAGAIRYPFEVVLTALLREGPSTEVMVCRKR